MVDPTFISAAALCASSLYLAWFSLLPPVEAQSALSVRPLTVLAANARSCSM